VSKPPIRIDHFLFKEPEGTLDWDAIE